MVSEVCSNKGNSRVLWSVTPSTDLLSALLIMNRHDMGQLPVILEHVEDHRGLPVGLLDRECISLACSLSSSGKLRFFISYTRSPEPFSNG
ncbi:hypothetical protein RJ640_026960 [Escallonia rubra]|uniref:CBS domain-containing protein n=1 Tax=Escallonia rubra TaxID=112253 RepID=A0AA88RE35_9ASTE|nr:hypothetical protein RJ640_026960 [Escallonia rubra]